MYPARPLLAALALTALAAPAHAGAVRGHVVDHIALGVPDLTGALDRLRKSGVKVLEESHPFGDGKTRAAMIEGPDAIAIELIEMK